MVRMRAGTTCLVSWSDMGWSLTPLGTPFSITCPKNRNIVSLPYSDFTGIAQEPPRGRAPQSTCQGSNPRTPPSLSSPEVAANALKRQSG
eukprot:3665151-Rhodomonas_salina.2